MKARLAISREPLPGPRAVPAGASARRGIEPPLPIHNVAVMALEGHRFGQMPVHDPGIFSDARHDEQRRDYSALDLAEMIERATSGTPDPLPYQSALEGRLGRSLSHVEAYSGPDVVTVLQTLDALAASVGNMILFATSQPDIGTVAHEVVHVLQSGGRSASEPSMISPRDANTEREAENLARDMMEITGGSASAPIGVSEQLPPDQVALQRSGSPAMAGDGNVTVLERPARPELDRIEEPAPATTPAQGTAAPRGTGSTTMPPAGEEAATAGAQLPPAPEPGVTAEDVAAREAALAEAEAALAGAGDVPQLMAQFAGAPPTVKAARQGQLAQDATDIAQQETQQFQEDLPDLHATMSSDAPAVEPIAVRSPDARVVVLEDAAPAPPPEPVIAETPDPGAFTANDNATRVIDQFFASAEPADRAGQVGESLGDVSTKDPEIPHTPGPPPAVPLEGESDPGRLAAQQGEALTGARGVRDEAQAAVIAGPGPEQSQPISVDESYAVDALNQPTVAPVVPAEGAREFLSMGLPPEVQTAFDQQQQPAMQASMEGAVSQADQAATERDQARQTEVESAQTQAAELSREAGEQQQTHIGAARATIQTERQKTLDAQSTAVQDMETSAAERSETDRESIETRVATDEANIGSRFQSAETEVGAEIKQGERDAETKKQEAARAAEKESWWDRAVNFVRDAFNALVDAINVVFDAVRSAVNKILDAAKNFALSVIDAAASFIKSAIAAFGEFLKAAINGLLGDVFPGLAAALSNAIDSAVTYAQGLVDDVANGLKAGVSALVDGLKAGLNRILDAFQAGLNVAIGLVQAALTGDWSALARKLLEAVLLVIGVDPESFYAFIGRAEETFQIILDDPLGFLGNVAEAFTGGVRLFADNILKHLQAGIIGWLTGTLGSAGITLPERFDLFGVLSLVQQILGLTWDRLRQKAVKLVGEQNVARLEHILSYIQTLVTEGWGGLWERIKGDIATLRDQVLDAIKSFILERIVMAAITKIASMFNPVGAIVQLVLTAWNLYTFLRDQLQRIFAVVQVVVNAIGDIARGVLAPGMAKVEEVLASLLPLALDLLARLLGLGNVGTKVREIIESIQQSIDRAIDGLIERVLAAFRGGGQADPATRQAQREAGLDEQSNAPIQEKFTLLGEEHTIRTVGVGAEITIEMASGPFSGLITRINGLTKAVMRDYVDPGGVKYAGPDKATKIRESLGNLTTHAQDLVNAVAKETDPKEERKLVVKGLKALVQLVFALAGHIPEITTEVVHGHGVKGGAPDGFGRATWFEVNPLSPQSLGKGGGPQDPVPGYRVLPGYQRGHLVAKSLGGPGTPDNLAPMSKSTNIERVGVVGVEDSLRYAIGKFRTDYPGASPPYVFSYRVTPNYYPAGGLQSELTKHGAKSVDEGELFNIARSATKKEPTSPALLAPVTLPAGLSAREEENFAGNIRRRLAHYFLPYSISARVQVIQSPTSYSAPIYQSGTAPNHIGIDKEWH